MLTNKDGPDLAGMGEQVDIGHKEEGHIDPLRHQLSDQQDCQFPPPWFPATRRHCFCI